MQSKKKAIKRNSSIELLRILFIVLIMLTHTYGHGSGDITKIYDLGNNFTTSWNLSLYSLCQLGVTGFMFISGYYGLHFSIKKLLKLFAVTFFYLLSLDIIFHNLRPHNVIGLMFPYSSWWFISVYFFIMLLSPFLEEGFKKISQQEFTVVLIGLWIYTYFCKFFTTDGGRDAVLLITVYISARYIRFYPHSIISRYISRGGSMLIAYSCDSFAYTNSKFPCA